MAMRIYNIFFGMMAAFFCSVGNSASIDVLFNESLKVYYVANINIMAGELRNTAPQALGVYFSFTSPAGSIECRQGYQEGQFTACPGAKWGTLPVYCPTAAEAIRRFKMMLTNARLTGESSANTLVEIACMSGPNSAWRFSGPVAPPLVLPAACKIDGAIALDHGLLNATDINENTASTNIKVECNKESDVILSLPDSGVISLDKVNNLRSNISLNSVKGGRVRISKVGPVGEYITVSSVLTSSGAVIGGEFSGSSIITLEVP